MAKTKPSAAKTVAPATRRAPPTTKGAPPVGKSAKSAAKVASPATGAKSAARATPRGEAPTRYKTIAVELRESVALVILSRPEVHNAFNATLIAELTRALRELDLDAGVRAVVLLGEGKSFCAGADLNWMRETAGFGATENRADANTLAVMLKSLYRLSKPTIARVHGTAMGGGAGLVACCDIAFAAQDATFSFSEAKLGLIPATIAPYVVEAIGARQARRYFLSAERFTAAEAFRIGLVHDICRLDEIDGRINELLGSLLVAGPRAQHESKALIRAVRAGTIDDTMIADTAARIARIRVSDEGREGVAAFLGKRSAAWVPQDLRKK